MVHCTLSQEKHMLNTKDITHLVKIIVTFLWRTDKHTDGKTYVWVLIPRLSKSLKYVRLLQNICIIRHIAITICPFRFAFSQRPRCGQLLRQKHGNDFTCLCACFSIPARFSDSSKSSQSVSLFYEWLAGFRKSEENMLKTSWKVVPVTKVAHICWWRHDNRKQSESAREHWCDISCYIPYCACILADKRKVSK